MTAGETTRAFIVGCLIEILQPRAVLDLPGWMEKHVILRREESVDGAGAYRRDRSIPMGKLFAKFNAGKWRRMFVMKGSQSAFTLHCLGDITKTVAEDPQNIIFSIDSKDEARRISKKRLGPMLEDCKATAGLWSENEDEQSALEYTFPGMSLWLIGSGSPGPYAGKTSGRNYADEVDKYPDLADEADQLDLLEQRGKEVEGSVLIAGSTPTTERGRIAKGYARGSKELYMVPCPHCGERQELKFEGLRFKHCRRANNSWDLREVLRDTYYECRGCKGRIEESDKPAMLEAGEWEPSNFEEIDGQLVEGWEPETMSAHLPDFYSVSPNSTWGRIAVEFIQAQGDPRRMHNFKNGREGVPVRDSIIDLKPAGLRRLVSGYVRGTMPEVPCILTLQADNQGSEVVKWVVSGWMPDGTMYVVDWGQEDSREALDDVMLRKFDCAGRMLMPQRAIMDEGGEDGTTWEVRDFCSKRWPVWVPAKGRAGRQINDLAKISKASIAKGGQALIPVVHFDDDAFKRLLYVQRIAKFDPAEIERKGLARMHLPKDTTDQFFRELSGESLKRVPGKGVMWVASPPNDYGDGVKLGHVLWNMIGGEFMDSV